jgi:hypothetical protein
MTRNGTAYPLAPLAPLTAGIASGSWPTPEAADGSGGRVSSEMGGTRPSGAKRAITLGTAVAHAGQWPTPQARDGQGRSTPGVELARSRFDEGKRCLEDAVSLRGNPGGMLNPTWVEWLLGFPLGWTDSERSETASSRRSPNGSGDG